MDNIRFNLKYIIQKDIESLTPSESLIPLKTLTPQVYLVMYYFTYQSPLIIKPLKTFRISRDQLVLELQYALSVSEVSLHQKEVYQAAREGLNYILASPEKYYIVA